MEVNETSNTYIKSSILLLYLLQQPPFIMKVPDDGDGKVHWKGYCIDLVNALSDLMGFDFELYQAPDGQYGHMNEQMEWDGAIKELIDQVKCVGLILIVFLTIIIMISNCKK